jgi:hypothetical protein
MHDAHWIENDLKGKQERNKAIFKENRTSLPFTPKSMQ